MSNHCFCGASVVTRKGIDRHALVRASAVDRGSKTPQKFYCYSCTFADTSNEDYHHAQDTHQHNNILPRTEYIATSSKLVKQVEHKDTHQHNNLLLKTEYIATSSKLVKQVEHKNMVVDWSSLPFDLLGAIAMKLTTFEEFLYFSSICRCWNHASSIIKQHWRAFPVVPWLLLTENTKENPDGVRKIFNIDSNKCYNFNLPEISGARCWGSPYGWVAIAKHDYSIQLFNPITKAQIHFPSLETIPKPPEYDEEDDDDGEENFRRFFLFEFLTKVIVLKFSQNGRDEFVIMLLHDKSKRLAFARHGDQSWTFVFVKDTSARILEGNYFPPLIVDVVAFDDHVFVLYRDREVGVWNVEDFSRLELIVPKSFSPAFKVNYSLEELGNHGEFELDEYVLSKMYLVQSGSDLLMVFRYRGEVLFDSEELVDHDQIMNPTFLFKVYRFEQENKSWEETKDLGEVALFVGDNFSMSISTANARCLHSNSIYFTDDENESLLDGYGFDEIGVYDLKSKEIRRFYEGDDTSSLLCSAIFFVPQF